MRTNTTEIDAVSGDAGPNLGSPRARFPGAARARAGLFVLPILAVCGCGGGAAESPWDPAVDSAGSVRAYEHYTRGELLEARGDFEDATYEFQKALAADPQDLYLRARLAMSYVEQGRPERAVRHIDRVLEEDPAYELGLFARATYHLATGDEQAAIEVGRRAVRAAPESATAALWLAELHESRGELVAAEELFTRVDAAARLDARRSLVGASVSARLGDAVTARARFEAVLARRPDLGRKVATIARETLLERAAVVAAEIGVAAIRARPGDHALRRDVVEGLLGLGLERRASVQLRDLPPLAPDDTPAHLDRACLLARVGQPRFARALLHDAFGAAPAQAAARDLLAALESALGRVEIARLLLGDRERPPGAAPLPTIAEVCAVR